MREVRRVSLSCRVWGVVQRNGREKMCVTRRRRKNGIKNERERYRWRRKTITMDGIPRDSVTKPNNVHGDRTIHLLLHRTADATTIQLCRRPACGPLELIRSSRRVLLLL